jgi:ankyrin repeat protein
MTAQHLMPRTQWSVVVGGITSWAIMFPITYANNQHRPITSLEPKNLPVTTQQLVLPGKDLLNAERTLLQLCCYQGLVEAVPLLLKAGCDPNLISTGVGHNPPFLIAAKKGNHQIQQILCNEEGLVINGVQDWNQTALHAILWGLLYKPQNVQKGIIQCLKILLEIPRLPSEKIDINAQDNSGTTAMHLAVESGNAMFIDFNMHSS